MVTELKKRALGRGLDALLPSAPMPSSSADRSAFVCALEKLSPQKGQPRQHLDAKSLDELTQSIKQHGLIEPIVVRRAGHDRFEIIAGERRWRACQKAGMREVLVVVKDVTPNHAFELALIENVQRADLNPIELAEALDRLLKEHGYTHESLAERLGKDRTTVTNALRLLRLPVRVRAKVITGELSEGHARALLGLTDGASIEPVAEKVIRGKLSVRATEALVRGARTKSRPTASASKSAGIRDLEGRLTRALGTKVEVRDRGNRGELVIPYGSLDALDRVLAKIL